MADNRFLMKQILIVDDDPVILRIMRMGLESAGYEVTATSCGAECFDRICEEAPDLLVTDIQMPGMSGKDLCLAIAKQFPDRTFPIVVLTGRAELAHREWTRDFPRLCFMEKPVSIRRLTQYAAEALAEGNDRS